MIEFILDFIAEFFRAYILFSPSKKDIKFVEHLHILLNEEWFHQLYNDYRYEYIIKFNKKVRKYLLNKENIDSLVREPKEKDSFVTWVKTEHEQFIWGKKK